MRGTMKTLENTYLRLLRLTPLERLNYQELLCGYRDLIAKISGRDPEEVQNEFEAKATQP